MWGVPADSHFGQMMVEADYRMKRLSMGLERTGVRGFRTHLSMLGRSGNSMQRWWFTPLYDAFLTTADGNAFQLNGQRLQLLAQEELATGTGKRIDSATTRRSTTGFAKLFTNLFPQTGREDSRVRRTAEPRRRWRSSRKSSARSGWRTRCGWKMSLFLDENRASVIKGYAPKQVHSIFNYKQCRPHMVLGLVGGGVVINPHADRRGHRIQNRQRGSLIEYRGGNQEGRNRGRQNTRGGGIEATRLSRVVSSMTSEKSARRHPTPVAAVLRDGSRRAGILLFCAAYLLATVWFGLRHVLGDSLSHPLAYFFTWDMFPGYRDGIVPAMVVGLHPADKQDDRFVKCLLPVADSRFRWGIQRRSLAARHRPQPDRPSSRRSNGRCSATTRHTRTPPIGHGARRRPLLAQPVQSARRSVPADVRRAEPASALLARS